LQITAPEPAIIQLKAKGEILIPVEAYPEHAHARLMQLNEALYPNRSTSPRRGRAGRGRRKGEDNRQELWRAYIFSRKILLESPEHVPMRTWHALWNKLAEESPSNLDRMGHIKYLGDDMLKAGVVLHPREHLLYIEALFIDDDHNSAIKRWEDLRSETAAQDTYHLERTHHNTDKRSFQVSYWELGIRMLSLVGKPDQAFEAAEILFRITREPAIYRALLPIIRAYLAVKSESSYRRAWALYVEMRLKMGSQVTMEDYDILISNFFNANQPYLALGVFKDMMLTGNETLAHRDSIASYSKTTDTSISLSKEIKAKEIDWQNAKPLQSLPAQFKNKFFFGSWVKKLIGDGELDLAKKVFDLAEDHGIRASPMHLNGLIGAWYRHGSDKYSALAEETAWKMIKARIDFVKEREQWNGITSPLRVVESDDLQSSRSIGIVSLTPHATIETFSVLIQQYRRRQRPDLASDLFDALKKAKVKPNTGFLNELLLSDTRAHNMAWAWETYHSLTSTKQVRPDLETFVILWNLEKRNVDPLLGQLSHKHEEVGTKFPPPRELFANMMEQLSAKALRLKAPKELYDMIMLCFCLKADLVGAAVALRALQHHFNAMPSADTVQMIVYSLARLGMKNESGEKPKRLETNSELTQERIAKVARLLDGFKNARIEALERHGINFDHLNSVAKNEQTELMLSDLLRHVSRARMQGDRWGKITAVTLSQITAEQMGVPDCSPWEASSTA
jgi:pentatricopeptide repeat protein